MASRRGRKRNDNLPPNRARDVQRAFRARRAAHLQELESRVAELEEENEQLRAALNMPPSQRPKLGNPANRIPRSPEGDPATDSKPEQSSSRHSSASMSPAIRVNNLQPGQSNPQGSSGGGGGGRAYQSYSITPGGYSQPPSSSSTDGGWDHQTAMLMSNGHPGGPSYFGTQNSRSSTHISPHSPTGRNQSQHSIYIPTYPMTTDQQKPSYDHDFTPPHSAYSYPPPVSDPPSHPHSPVPYGHPQQTSSRDTQPSSSGHSPRRSQTDPSRIINQYPYLPPMQLSHPTPAGRHPTSRSAPLPSRSHHEAEHHEATGSRQNP